MRGRGWPRSELADCLMRDQDIPDVRARGPGVHEIFGSFERGAGIELAPRALDVAARESPRARWFPHRRWRRRRRSVHRCHRCPRRESCQRLVGAQAAARPPAPGACCGRRGRAAPAASPSIHHPTPAHRSRGAQCRDEMPRRPRPHHRRTASRQRLEREAVRARRLDHRAHRDFDVRDHVTLDARSASPASWPNNPEPITSGIVAGHVGDEQRERVGVSPSSRAMPPPLMRESRARSALSVAMSQPAASPRSLSARRSLERDAFAQRFDQARAAARDEEYRPDALAQRLARAARARRRPRGCARRAPDARSRACVTPGTRRSSRIDMTVLGDDQHVLDAIAERVMRAAAPWHSPPCRRRTPRRVRGSSASRRKRSTYARPSTARSAASNSSSRTAARVHGVRARARADGSDLDDLEAVLVAVAPRCLGHIGTLRLQARQVFGSDVAGDVVARETRGVEFLDAGMIVHAGLDEIFEILVDQPVGADELRDFRLGAIGWPRARSRPACRCRRRSETSPAARPRRNTPSSRPLRARGR